MLQANKTSWKQTLVFLLTYQLCTSWRRWAWRRWSPSSSSYTACCRGSRGGHLWCFWHRMFCTRTPWSASPLWWCSHLWQREGAERSKTKTEGGETRSEWDVLGESGVETLMPCVLSYLDTVWMTKTSLPRTDSWICTRVSMETNGTWEEKQQECKHTKHKHLCACTIYS